MLMDVDMIVAIGRLSHQTHPLFHFFKFIPQIFLNVAFDHFCPVRQIQSFASIARKVHMIFELRILINFPIHFSDVLLNRPTASSWAQDLFH